MSENPRVIDAELENERPESPKTSPEPEAPPERGPLVAVRDQPPEVLPAIILDDLVPFPGTAVPVLLDSPARRDAVLHARSNHGLFVLINRKPEPDAEETNARSGIPQGDLAASASIAGAMMNGEASEYRDDPFMAEDEPQSAPGTPHGDDTPPTQLSDLCSVGILARVLRVFQLPDQRLSALVELTRRVQPVAVLKTEPFVVLRVLTPPEVVTDEESFAATYRQVRIHLARYLDAHPSLPHEVRTAALAIQVPGALADFVAQHLSRGARERLDFLAELDLGRRMHKALEVTIRENDLLTVGNRISEEIRAKVEKHQREFFLREQLKAIRVELGEEQDPQTLAIRELQKRLDEAGLPERARERADEELRRLQLLPSESPEHNVVRSYLDWIASLPWSTPPSKPVEIQRARQVLDEDHYGLEEIKDRIVEYLAVRQLNPEAAGSLLCFAGPPGVGKTSLGQSIARALGREFYRFSVGGMRDEAEIKGHRRTYVGAMPGRVLQALKQVKTNDPVIMLDELDKMGSDWRGDPSSAMLEVLDPAQNHSFMDHYLDLTFDLSKVMFIATANIKTEIPGPLLDRLEVIDLPGYIPEEKFEIARRHLVRRQRKNHGLQGKHLRVGSATVRHLIRRYTHEAGVRELDRLLAKLCRKRATEVVAGVPFEPTISADHLPKYLGPPKLHEDELSRRPRPGVAVGLAWTPVGGEVLTIESVAMPGKGRVRVTGQLGEVMSESAQLAISYVRHRCEELEVDVERFEKSDLHIHFPAGAVKKDGPSAGITITTALISLLQGRPIAPKVAMTGEMTLRGDVLPVGGIREKVVAARRAGVRTVIVPEANRADVEEIPQEVTKGLTFVYARTYADVYPVAFPRRGSKGEGAAPKVNQRPSLNVSNQDRTSQRVARGKPAARRGSPGRGRARR